MKTIFFSCLAVSLVVLFPPEFIRNWEREFAGNLVQDERFNEAQVLYRLLRLQRDPIGISNYHALSFHHSVSEGLDKRKDASIAAERAW